MTLSPLTVCAVLMCIASPARAEAPPCVDGSSPELKGVPYIGTRERGWFGNLDVKPAEKRTLQIYVRQGPGTSSPRACVQWTLAPLSPASIEPKAGVLTIDRQAPDGTLITVVGQVPGLPPLQAVFHVFDPNHNPLVGKWKQVAPPSCRRLDSELIAELELRADGTFAVTWHPFESYVDYWGSYVAVEKAGTVRFSVENGNFVPPNFRGEGRFSMDARGHLHLEDVWLGSRQDRDAKAGPQKCSYEFAQD